MFKTSFSNSHVRKNSEEGSTGLGFQASLSTPTGITFHHCVMPTLLPSKDLHLLKQCLKMAIKTKMKSLPGDEPSNASVTCANIMGKMVTGKRNMKNHTGIAKGLTVSCKGTTSTSTHGLAPSQRGMWVNEEKANINARRSPMHPTKELRTWKNPLTLTCSSMMEPVCTSPTETLVEQSN
jgi:hypothetical protein